MSKMKLLGGAVLVVVIGGIAWYSVAANYDYGALAGIYVFQRKEEKCTLYLRSDQTFLEELTLAGAKQKATGRWHRFGEAHVSFSGEFLKLSGQELNGSGEAHGQFDKSLGLFPSLTLAPFPDGPTFRRKFTFTTALSGG